MARLPTASIIFLQVIRDLRLGKIVRMAHYTSKRGKRFFCNQSHMQVRPCYLERDGTLGWLSLNVGWFHSDPTALPTQDQLKIDRWAYSAMNEWTPNDLYEQIVFGLEEYPTAYDYLAPLTAQDAQIDPFLTVLANALRGVEQRNIPGAYTLQLVDGVLVSKGKDLETVILQHLPAAYAQESDDAVRRAYAPAPATV